MSVVDNVVQLYKKVAARTDGWENEKTGIGTTRDKAIWHLMSRDAPLTMEECDNLFHQDDMAMRAASARPIEYLREGFDIIVEPDEEAVKAREEALAKARADLAAKAGLPEKDPESEPEEPAKETAPATDALTPADPEMPDIPDPKDEADDQAKAIEEHLTTWDVCARLTETAIWAAVQGGACLFVGAEDGQDPAEPLNEDGIQTIKFLRVLDRNALRIAKRYEFGSAKYGEPEVYEILPTAQTDPSDVNVPVMPRIHESRMIRFRGALTSELRQRENDGWDYSLYQATQKTIARYDSIWQSTTHLVQDASQGVWKIFGLFDLIQAGQQSLMSARMALTDLYRSVARSVLVDAEKGEDFTRVGTQFSGLDSVLTIAERRLAAAFRMPVTVLMGMSPGGLNATGDSDIRLWYDSIRNEQQAIILPRLKRLITLMMKAKDGPTKGKVPEHWRVAFRPLWQQNPTEQAAERQTVVTTDAALITSGILDAETVTRSRFGSGKWSSEYTVDVEAMLARKAVDKAKMQAQLAKAPPPAPGQPPPAAGKPPFPPKVAEAA